MAFSKYEIRRLVPFEWYLLDKRAPYSLKRHVRINLSIVKGFKRARLLDFWLHSGDIYKSMWKSLLLFGFTLGLSLALEEDSDHPETKTDRRAKRNIK